MTPPRIVLVGTKDAANAGSAARAMKNFGMSELVLVAPRCRLDRRAYALASHAGDVLDAARIVDRVEEAVEDVRWVVGTSARLRSAGNFPVHTPRTAAAALRSAPSAAVLFGPEDHGLDNASLNLCQAYVSIPTAEYASLNLAQAVVVLAYEWFHAGVATDSLPHGSAGGPGGPTEARPRREITPPAASGSAASGSASIGAAVEHPAPRGQMERFYVQMLETFHLIGFTDVQRQGSVDRLFRGIFDRVALTDREVAALRGLWSQVTWAANQPPERLPERRDRR